MKKTTLLILLMNTGAGVSGQKPETLIMKAAVPSIIDAMVDEITPTGDAISENNGRISRYKTENQNHIGMLAIEYSYYSFLTYKYSFLDIIMYNCYIFLILIVW